MCEELGLANFGLEVRAIFSILTTRQEDSLEQPACSSTGCIQPHKTRSDDSTSRIMSIVGIHDAVSGVFTATESRLAGDQHNGIAVAVATMRAPQQRSDLQQVVHRPTGRCALMRAPCEAIGRRRGGPN
jgi:hypothetical protein